MRALAVVISTAILTLLLAACVSAVTQRDIEGGYDAKWIRLPDKSRVICVFYDASYGNGLSCDWEGRAQR